MRARLRARHATPMLARLREDGLVSARKSGTAVFYRIADPAALQVIGVLAEIFCPPASA